MNRSYLPNATLLCLLIAVGCNNELPVPDIIAPVLVSVSPSTSLKAEGDAIELHFSEPVVNVKKGDVCFRLAKSDEISAAQILSSAKLKSLDKAGAFVPLTAKFSESADGLVLSPLVKLEFEQNYSLWILDCLRDYAGNPLVLNENSGAYSEYRFKVERGPFELTRHDVQSKPEAKVPPNRKYFHFSFSHPVLELPRDAVVLDGQALKWSLSDDRLTIRATLEDSPSTCEKMQPDAPHILRLSTAIKDDEGNLFSGAAFNFVSERACLLRKANMIGRPRVFAYDNYVEFAFDSPLLAVAKVRFGPNGSSLDCLGQSCPEFSPHMSSSNGVLKLKELPQDKVYRYEVDVEDLYGEHAQYQGQFETRRMATIALNEILANPKITDGRRESTAEFIELYNYGDEAVDLSKFSIEVGSKTCRLSQDASPLMLQGRSYMLLVGTPFAPELFGLLDGPEIHRMQGQTICGNLRNWPLPSIALRDDRNRLLDDFFEMPLANAEGFSIERLNAEAKNEKGQYCYSRKDIGPTPLGENGVVRRGCEKE